MTAPGLPQDKTVIVARFGTHDGAEGCIARLKAAHVRMGNVAHIEKNHAGEVKFHESQDWGIGKSAVVGAVAALILPGIGLLLGAAAGALAAYFVDAGFPDALLQQTGSGLLQPDQSALVALVQSDDRQLAEGAITAAGGTIVGSGVEGDLARVLDAARGAA